MMRLIACYVIAQIALLPLYALSLWMVPRRAALRFQWAFHRMLFCLAVVLPFALLAPVIPRVPQSALGVAHAIAQVIAAPAPIPSPAVSVASKRNASFLLNALFLLPALGLYVFGIRLGRQKARERALARGGSVRRIGQVEVIVSPAVTVPFSTGVLRPRIFISMRVAKNPGPFAMVFRHESFHVRRRHWLWTIAESLVAHLFWFNPLVHLFPRGGRQIRELLCDAEVCRRHSPTAYGHLLLDLAAFAGRGARIALADAWVTGGMLKDRIQLLLGKGKIEMKVFTRIGSVGAAVLAVALFAFGLSFLTPAAAQPTSPGDNPTTSSQMPVQDAESVAVTVTRSGTWSGAVTLGGLGARSATGLAMFDSSPSSAISGAGGADFIVHAPGTPAVATADAFVEDIWTAPDGTTTLSMVTASGYRAVYSHREKALVRWRQFVSVGQELGTLARSRPDETEYTLHYEVFKDGREVFPFTPVNQPL